MLCFKNHFDADNLMFCIPIDQGEQADTNVLLAHMSKDLKMASKESNK